jgi:hypothetical protein
MLSRKPKTENKSRRGRHHRKKILVRPPLVLLYEFNPTWIKVSACSGRALIRIAGTNALYILHHSWKSFFDLKFC